MSEQKLSKDFNESKVITWLDKNDIRLWTYRVQVKEARDQCSRSVGFRVSAGRFSSLRKLVCEYWRKEPHVTPSECIDLTDSEWSDLNRFVRRWKRMLSELDEMCAVSLARMCGLKCNAALLSECQAWKSLRKHNASVTEAK